MRASKKVTILIFWMTLIFGGVVPDTQAAPVNAPVAGEIEYITINNPTDPWSGGTIVVGGESVIIPRNLLIDLPANRLTLKQLFDQAPAACLAVGETGLAKADLCNQSGTGGFATIAANLTNGGNVIAGDVLIQKGVELVAGIVTFIDYTDGYFRVDGVPGDPNTGVMIRINDPTGRHTVQQGLGCLGGALNCSPDPRFNTDPDNYIIAFTTGYPACLPSTVQRTFVDVLGLGVTTAQSTSSGTGDVLCPDTNRSINGGQPVDDSRRFAPLQLGDHVTVNGNFETINCVRFISAYSLRVSKALSTKNLATQPDYMFIDMAFIEAPGFQDQKIESLFSGSTTRAPADVVIYSVHNDPAANQPHEFLLATTLGCDAAAGVGSCTSKAVLPPVGFDIFSISHVVDFRLLPTERLLDPCAHLRADSRFIPLNVCPGGGTFAEQFSILSPLPRQIHGKTGLKLSNPGLVTLDIRGNQAPNGQYYFQMGFGLASIQPPGVFNLDLINTPFSFSGVPWNLDRRLSPGGCNGPCEATAQPLDPFPFEGIDPRIQATTPTGPYIDPNFTRGILSTANNRVLSYVSGTPVNGLFNFDGNNTILAWPPVDPAPIPILAVPPITPRPSLVSITSFPVFTANRGQTYSYQVTATNGSTCGGLTYSLDLAPAGMTIGATGLIQWKPVPLQVGPNSVIVRATEPGGAFDTQSFGIVVADLGPAGTADFDGDGKTDISVWRPGDGNWYTIGSKSQTVTIRPWGGSGDIPVAVDFDGDGKTDVAVWRPSNGTWYIVNSATGAVTATQWGGAGDTPVAADFDGDGKADKAVWRSADGTWYVINSTTGAATVTQWGGNGDVPLAADFDGDGKADMAVWRPADGNWYVINSTTGAATVTQWGGSGDVPLAADFDGDGKADVAVWRPADGTWYVINSATGAVTATQWGGSGDVPVAADFDGDGKADKGVWRPADGNWYIINSATGLLTVTNWGANGDTPIK